MRQSLLFTKTRKEAPTDEQSKNAELLIRGGFIHKEMAGVYSYMPLGLRVLNKVVNIIREEMNAVDGQEVFLSALQDKGSWEKSGRWSDEAMDIWFKTALKADSLLGLAPTHEEPLTAIMKDHIFSYRDLPRFVYQFQTKFRKELRSKSGILRGREFLMKDLYSFCKSQEEQDNFYERMKGVYAKIFERAGVGEQTYITFASGGSFSKYSHEFQTLTSAGEDIIYICDNCKIAVNNELIEELKNCPQCGNSELRKEKAIEVGNIFPLGTRFSEALDLSFVDIDGEKKYVVMGSYGIGPGRLIGTLVEVFSEGNAMCWPKAVAPFDVHLLLLSPDDEKARIEAENLYNDLKAKGIEVLYDDREARAGEKFADADLIGIPLRVVVSKKTVEEGKIEVNDRLEKQVKKVTKDEFFSMLK
ncbi:MAG: aminoacyl--tRNA ligase-related protein [Candidatus Paceibacterota bacterium]